jgi:hypothetical protein
MSITTASICLSNYIGLPIDVVNYIARYAGIEKWIPQFDTKNNLTGKINKESEKFDELSDFWNNKPRTIIRQTIILNNVAYKGAVYIQYQYVGENHDIHMMMYISIEISDDVYHYLSIVHSANPYSNPVIQFVKGELHRPLEPLSLNRQRQITAFRIENGVIFATFNDFQVEYIWNVELNIGEYIVDIPVDELDDYAMLL